MAGWQSGMFQPGDMMEAFTAKGEKRAPVFEGLPPLPGAR
jgi:enoyl-CoA hydratase